MKVLFLHLDLGIGGAEQLIVNAAAALLSSGHDVVIYTTHHSKDHCFAQTKGNGLLAQRIVVAGDWLPRSFGKRGVALCASIRMIYLACYVLACSGADVCVCDGVATPLPLLWLRFPTLFYCHFPDKALCTSRGTFFKRLYRAPLDWLEGYTLAWASKTVVNSKFTAGVFQSAFPELPVPSVIYPSMDFASFTPPDWTLDRRTGPFVSLNRFERKKNIGLAIRALAAVISSGAAAGDARLVVAGGYDPALLENREHLEELKKLSAEVLSILLLSPSL